MLRSHHVLVVEDDPQMAEIIHTNLVAAGIPATSVPDGIQALRALDEVRPTLVTMDLNVPDVSGFRLLFLFKKYAPDLPVIVVTGFEYEEAEEVAHAGADDFVTKPFDPDRLVARIRDLLDRPRTETRPRPSGRHPKRVATVPGVA